MKLAEKFRNILSAIFKRRTIVFMTPVALLAIWGITRGCSSQEAMQKTVFTIARDSSWYPLQLFGKDRNLQAFTNDLVAAIAAETKLNFIWLSTGPASLIEGLNDGHYDAALSTLRPNFINRDKYVFSDLIFETGPVLVVQQDSKASSLKDMKDKTVGIRAGSSLIFNTIKESGAHAYNILITTFDNLNKALEALDKNQIDGVIMDAIFAYAHTEGFYAGRLKVVTSPLTDEGIRLVALRNEYSDQLIEAFDEALRTLIENGTYEQLMVKWNLIDPQTRYINK